MRNHARFINALQIGGLSFGLGCLLLGCTLAATPDADADASSSIAQAPVVQEDLTQMLPISAEVKIADQVVQLEVARTPDQQAQGLMYRPALPDNRGMLFSFESPYLARFWMKNTPQPLDMVFLLDGKVKAVIADVPPCTSQPCPTYGPETLVNQVIELRSGRAAELGLKAGDQLDIRFLEPQPN